MGGKSQCRLVEGVNDPKLNWLSMCVRCTSSEHTCSFADVTKDEWICDGVDKLNVYGTYAATSVHDSKKKPLTDWRHCVCQTYYAGINHYAGKRMDHLKLTGLATDTLKH